jgi:hypothetical protein
VPVAVLGRQVEISAVSHDEGVPVATGRSDKDHQDPLGE